MYQAYVNECSKDNLKPVFSCTINSLLNTTWDLVRWNQIPLAHVIGQLAKLETCKDIKKDTSGHLKCKNSIKKMQLQQAAVTKLPSKHLSPPRTSAASRSDILSHLIYNKTLPLPKLYTSVAFYLRQLWLYNCGIHVISNKANGAYFQLRTDDESGRCCNEICSSLLAFFDFFLN